MNIIAFCIAIPLLSLSKSLPCGKKKKRNQNSTFLADAKRFSKAEKRLKNDFDIVRLKAHVRENHLYKKLLLSH